MDEPPLFSFNWRTNWKFAKREAFPTLDGLLSSDYPYGVFAGPDKQFPDSFRMFDDFFAKDEFMVLTDGDFCAVFDHNRSRFMIAGGKTYNYHRRIN
jgi:hypothetical protein